MTIVEDRPAVGAVEPPASPVRSTPAARWSTWRFAARLARREVRRRPGRTLLVMLLVAIPVIGMTGASIVARSTFETNAESFARQFGTADVVVYDGLEQPVGAPSPPPTLPDDLPDGTRTTTYFGAFTSVRALIDGEQVGSLLGFTDIDLNDPITSSTVIVEEGRVPKDPGEVLLSPGVAEDFGVEVGDRLRLIRPGLELTVVGLGRDRSTSSGDPLFDGSPLMVVDGFDRELLQPGSAWVQTLVDLPDRLSDTEREAVLDEMEMDGLPIRRSDEAFYVGGASVSVRQIAWGWVAGVLAFVAVGIVIAAAFATSARRQLVTIGQLASNGAAPHLVRRTMGLQGMWTGLLGAAIGLPVGLAASVVVSRTTLLDRFAGRPVDGLVAAPLDLLVIALTAIVAATIAALVPARSAARIPVLSALAGRRPVAQPPRWLAPVGVAAFVVGLLLLAAAASVERSGDLIALVAVFGGLAVVFGMVCASPLIISAVATVGSRRGGVTRLASRSLGRSRARSAAVLTAVATVGTIAVIASTVTAHAESLDRNVATSDNIVQLGYFQNAEAMAADDSGIVDPEPVIAAPLPDVVRSDIERVLPDATWTPLTEVAYDPPAFYVETGSDVAPPGVGAMLVTGALVVDADLLALAGFSDDQQAELDRTGVLVLGPYFDDEIAIGTLGDPIEVDVSGSLDLIGLDGAVSDPEVETVFNETSADPARQISDVFVSQAFVDDNGLTTSITRYQLVNPDDITRDEAQALINVQSIVQQDAFVAAASAPGFEQTGDGINSAWYANASYPSTPVPWLLIRVAVAVASLVLVLAVVAIGLSLAAAESRDERDVLLAVGASPSTLRRVAATKAWVLTTGAGLVAVPVGFITIYVIMEAIDSNDVQARFPWAIALGLVVAIPAVAWLVTLITSAAAQRFRPVTSSTLATD